MATEAQSASAVPRVEATALRRLVRDLRNPLTSVVGYLDLVLEGGAGPLSAEQREFVAVAARNAYAMLSMLDVDRFAVALGVQVSGNTTNR
jgi:signal transduction histidine kinase